MGQPELALRHYDEALRITPENAAVRWNRALTLILLGQWEEGWREYEWRWVNNARRRTIRPMWDGCELGPDKTLYLWREQGFGDTLMMLRFLGKVRARAGGARIVLEVQPEIFSLLSDLVGTPALEIVAPLPDDTFARSFDAHLPLMSIPALLGLKSPEEVPTGHLFRAIPDEKVRTWAAGRKLLGICWQGNPGHAGDRLRSLPPAIVREFVAALPEDIGLVSLCPGLPIPGAEGPGTHASRGCYVFDPATFEETTGVLECLDVIVTVDTMVAHLAGCCGVEAHVLLPLACDYRWLAPGMRELRDETSFARSSSRSEWHARSCWYESVTLYRQTAVQEWRAPLREVLSFLDRRLDVRTDPAGLKEV